MDEVLPLDLEASELLSDTFEILSCKEIKLSAMRSRPEEDLQPEEDRMAMADAVMQVAQKKLISQVSAAALPSMKIYSRLDNQKRRTLFALLSSSSHNYLMCNSKHSVQTF